MCRHTIYCNLRRHTNAFRCCGHENLSKLISFLSNDTMHRLLFPGRQTVVIRFSTLLFHSLSLQPHQSLTLNQTNHVFQSLLCVHVSVSHRTTNVSHIFFLHEGGLVSHSHRWHRRPTTMYEREKVDSSLSSISRIIHSPARTRASPAH